MTQDNLGRPGGLPINEAGKPSSPAVGIPDALSRVKAALERAEEELPRLAAPDGTVAVSITDLRAIISAPLNLLNPAKQAMLGCYCRDVCMAPVIMGRQQPCRRIGGQ